MWKCDEEAQRLSWLVAIDRQGWSCRSCRSQHSGPFPRFRLKVNPRRCLSPTSDNMPTLKQKTSPCCSRWHCPLWLTAMMGKHKLLNSFLYISSFHEMIQRSAPARATSYHRKAQHLIRFHEQGHLTHAEQCLEHTWSVFGSPSCTHSRIQTLAYCNETLWCMREYHAVDECARMYSSPAVVRMLAVSSYRHI
jgi:hypothetical protein